MTKIAYDQIIGIDVSRDWLDIHCLPEGKHARFANTNTGHQRLIELAQSARAIVCFEATGGQEWQLWAALNAAGTQARQLPPAQIKARRKQGLDTLFEEIDDALCMLLDRQIAELESRIEQLIPTSANCDSRGIPKALIL